MEALTDRLERTLGAAFPGAERVLSWSEEDPDTEVTAFVVWAGFEGKDHFERQKMQWDVVRRAFSEDERQGIIGLFSETPREHAVAAEQ